MLLANRDSMTLHAGKGGGLRFVRYVKLGLSRMYGDTGTKNKAARISRLELVDDSGNYYDWPIDTAWTIPAGSQCKQDNDKPDKLLDHKTNTRMLCQYITLPAVFTFDVGANNLIDLRVFKKWQWWFSSAATTYPNQNLGDFTLAVSDDGETWHTVDSVTDFSAPLVNSGLAYEGNIKL